LRERMADKEKECQPHYRFQTDCAIAAHS
jgi:hypothetical protein